MTLEEFQKRIAALPPEKLEAMLIRCRQEGPAEALPMLVAEQIRRRAAAVGATVETDPRGESKRTPENPPPAAKTYSTEDMPPAPGKPAGKAPDNQTSAKQPPPVSPSRSAEPKTGYPKVIPQPEGPWGLAYKGAFAAVFTLGALRLLLRLLRR